MIELKPAYSLPLADLAALFNAAFTGYVGGDIQFTAAALARFLASGAVDLALSQIILRDEQPVGFGFVARQGWTSRLAAFGIVPEVAGQGIGKAAMQQMIVQASERGDRFYELEVIEQNPRAVRLYAGVGFTTLRRLVGYQGQPPEGLQRPAPNLQTLDVYEVARQIVQHGALDLPWQLAGTTIARHAPPDLAFTLDAACAVISNPAAETIALRALLVPPDLRRQGRASRLLSALFARYPDKTWVVPAICPEALGAELPARLGFERQPISHWHMPLTL